jgi:hypothetical protein
MAIAKGAPVSDHAVTPRAPVVVFCHVALDERNGGGMRTLIGYLGHLDYSSVLSVHFGDTPDTNQHGLREVRYLRIAKHRFPLSLLNYYLAARKAVRSAGAEPTCILFPNTWDDMLLGLVATFTGTRTCLWLMDDFISTLTQVRSIRSALMSVLFRQLYRRAARRVAVWTPMAREYQKRYGKGVDLLLGKRWPRGQLCTGAPRTSNISATDPLRLVWVGKYQPYYHQPIADLSAILREHPELPVTVDLYGQSPPERGVELPSRVAYRGPFDDSTLLHLLREYDYGLLTYSFDEHTRTFMRYSFPGKLIDYISAGLPVITISPPDVSICADVNGRDIGPCVFSRDSTSILAMLRHILSADAAQVARWRANSSAWAASEFVLEEGVRDFRRVFGVRLANG